MVIPFGTGWLFGPAAEGSSLPGFDDSGFTAVTLPHTVTPLSWQDWDPAAWERVWAYRKHFDTLPDAAGAPGAPGASGRVFLDVGAALTHSTVTLNGTEVGDYLGGYLPFAFEITGLLQSAGNVLAVRLDSGFNLNAPPDRPAPAVSTAVDFWQPGGIYRDVRLRVVPEVFLADVFAKPVNLLDTAARQVVVQVTCSACCSSRSQPLPRAGRRVGYAESMRISKVVSVIADTGRVVVSAASRVRMRSCPATPDPGW